MWHKIFLFVAVISSVIFILGTAVSIYSCFYGYEGFDIGRRACRPGRDLGWLSPYSPKWGLDDASFAMGVTHARVKIVYLRSFLPDNHGSVPHGNSTKYSLVGQWEYPEPDGPWFKYERRGGSSLR